MRSAFVDIVKSRGFRGLYAGLSPTLVEIVPYAGLQFGTYDMFRRWAMVISSNALQKCICCLWFSFICFSLICKNGLFCLFALLYFSHMHASAGMLLYEMNLLELEVNMFISLNQTKFQRKHVACV